MLFTKKSLSTILGTFQKTIDDLAALETQNAQTVTENQKTIETLAEDNRALFDESLKAGSVREKLADLIAV